MTAAVRVKALEAMREGADLRGMYIWTLIDNFEWHEDFQHNFGLYACDMGDPDLPRLPRQESVAMVHEIHRMVSSDAAEVRRSVGELVGGIQRVGRDAWGLPSQ
jgi:hypothetical protein